MGTKKTLEAVAESHWNVECCHGKGTLGDDRGRAAGPPEPGVIAERLEALGGTTRQKKCQTNRENRTSGAFFDFGESSR